MSPLFSKLVPLSLPLSLVRPTRHISPGNSNHHLFEVTSRGLEFQNPRLSKTENSNRNSRLPLLRQEDLKEGQGYHKAKDPSRWSQWLAKQSDSRTIEIADLKPIWNYLLGESGFSDLLSYIHPDKKESLQMVVEPKNKGLVLYVFWESKETGAMGIQFHYDPEKDKPILVEITTEQSIQREGFSKQLVGLIRDFPQIRSVQIETWLEESFNREYR